jgi:hypothetical protein
VKSTDESKVILEVKDIICKSLAYIENKIFRRERVKWNCVGTGKIPRAVALDIIHMLFAKPERAYVGFVLGKRLSQPNIIPESPWCV